VRHSGPVHRFCILLLLLAATSTTLSGEQKQPPPSRANRQTFLERYARGYYPGRTGQILVVPREGHFITRRDPSVAYMHGSPWDYDARIPFFFYGPGFINQGTFPQTVSQQDMAPTLAALLGVSMPGTSNGPAMRAILKPGVGAPRVIVLAVLDGMRVDYFDRHKASMPTFDRLRRQGAWFANARIDYLPTITSLGHATIATGAHARFHGITGNAFWDWVGGKATDSYPGLSPRYLMALTLSDVWNLRTEGRAVIIGQGSIGRAALPLAGHGACQANGRQVIAVSYSLDSGAWESNPECYRFPDYLKAANARTIWEASNGVWMGHPIANADQVRRSSLFSKFETDALKLLIEHEPLGADEITDMLSVNLKTPDYVGHTYGPDSKEIGETVAALDRDFGSVLAALDAKVGRDRYVVAVTADHGMPAEPDTRAGRERRYSDDVVKMIHQTFDPANNLVKQYEPENGQLAISRTRLRELGLTLDAIARFLEKQPFIFAAYTEDEVASAATTSQRAPLSP